MLRFKVVVTQDDILNGVPEDICQCPIAIALKRRFPKDKVQVGLYGIYIGGKTYLALQSSRQVVYDFIRDFDTKKRVKPFSFYILQRK